VLGDLHAEDEALVAALALFDRLGASPILSVGDIADGEGDIDRTCSILAARGIECVRGNHERWLLANQLRDLPSATLALSAESRAFLASLPVTREYETVAGRLLLCHGIGDNDMGRASDDHLQEIVREGRYAWVVNGHSHRHRAQRFGPVTVVNAGTLRRDHQPHVLVLDLSTRVATYYDVLRDFALAETFAL